MKTCPYCGSTLTISLTVHYKGEAEDRIYGKCEYPGCTHPGELHHTNPVGANGVNTPTPILRPTNQK